MNDLTKIRLIAFQDEMSEIEKEAGILSVVKTVGKGVQALASVVLKKSKNKKFQNASEALEAAALAGGFNSTVTGAATMAGTAYVGKKIVD